MFRKKITAYIFALFFAFTASNAHAQALEQLDLLISPGITFGTRNFYPNVGFGAPMLLNVDFAVHELLSLGAYGGLAYRKGTALGKFKAWNLGARASFHLWNFLDYRVAPNLMSEEIDVYVAIVSGFENSNYQDIYPSATTKFKRFVSGPIIGARWYFVDQIAVFGEAGYGPWGFFTLGVTGKLWLAQ